MNKKQNTKPIIDNLTKHEALHMAHVIADLFEREIVDSRFIKSDVQLKMISQIIRDNLSSFHQKIGIKTLRNKRKLKVSC